MGSASNTDVGLNCEPDISALILGLCANPDAAIELDGATCDPAWFESLVVLSFTTRTAPLLHRALIVSNPASISDGLEKLLDARQKSMRYALVQSRSLMLAASRLEEANLPFILLKGFGLAFAHYPEPGLRPMRDIDMLFAKERAESARHLLLGSGFRTIANAGHYGVERMHHLPEIEDPQHGVIYEVHHRANRYATPKLDTLQDYIEGTAREIELFGRRFRVPSDEANLLHLVAHATVHHLFANGPLVLADLHYLAHSQALDWNTVTARAREFGLERGLHLLAAVARLHGARWVPEDALPHDAVPSELCTEAARTMLLDEEGNKEMDMLRRQGREAGSTISLRQAAWNAFSPDPVELGKLANTTADDPYRYTAYPRWAITRLRRYFAVRNADGRSAQALRDWIRTDCD